MIDSFVWGYPEAGQYATPSNFDSTTFRHSCQKLLRPWYILTMDNFWGNLSKPFFALAPLEDVTDAAFRRLIASYGKPDVMFTEFTSADGLILADAEGQKKLRKKLLF